MNAPLSATASPVRLAVGAFTVAIFLSAALLFVVQPMVGKMILPLLGGTPAVWNTCMVFYQLGLLAGYAYAHASTKLLGVRRQAVVHLLVMVLPLLALPITVPDGWAPPATSNPAGWVLALLLVTVGLPFVVVSTSGPLLQRWFAATGHPDARDPYFLYAASNLGSMLALLSYPLLVEPTMRLAHQRWAWAGGYVALLAVTAWCARFVWRGRDGADEPRSTPRPAEGGGAEGRGGDGVTWRQRLWWVVLAFVPSSYLLGVTSHITADIAAVPLLWVVPLALYLLSFILVFARRQFLPHALMVAAMPYVVLTVAVMMLAESRQPAALVLGLHLLGLFVVAMVCHGQLVRRRPPASHLTEFYLFMSVGGALGGAFNALLAPIVFNGTYEYPIALALACLLAPERAARAPKPQAAAVPVGSTSRRKRKGGAPAPEASESPDAPRQVRKDTVRLALDTLLPVVTCVVTWAALVYLTLVDVAPHYKLMIAAGPAAVALAARHRPLRFGLCVAALFAGMVTVDALEEAIRLRQRSFFGVHQVTVVLTGGGEAGLFHELTHGTTVHGRQRLDPATRQPADADKAVSYYDPAGPVGDLFRAWAARPPERRLAEVAVVGLGTGNLVTYAGPETRVTFYEIDPVVREIAEDSGHFTYLANARARGVDVETVLGDARLTLARRPPDRPIDLLVLDAFSGDAIPIHLMTREAFAVYREKVRDGGWVVFHISNHFLELRPVIAALAADAGWQCLIGVDDVSADEGARTGRFSSTWTVLARREEDFGALLESPRWTLAAPRDPEANLWTDDYSNIIKVFDW